MKQHSFLFLFLFLSFAGWSQNGQLDMTFNPNDVGFAYGDGANNYVQPTYVMPDGKIVIGGNFNDYNTIDAHNFVKLDSTGKPDPTFNIGSGFNGRVNAIIAQPDGKLIVAGDFTTYDGTTVNRIVRLGSTGTRDATFSTGAGFDGAVYDLVLQPDGKIIAAGSFLSFRGTSKSRIARINANGTVDNTFSSGIISGSYVNRVALQSNGMILIGGKFTNYSGTLMNNIARLNVDGTKDAAFNTGTGFDDQVRDIEIRPDGKMLVCGYFTNYNGTTANRIIALNSDGSIYSGFSSGTGFSNYVLDISLCADNKLIVGGNFTNYNGLSVSKLVKLDSVGTPDPAFNVTRGPNFDVRSINRRPDGKTLLAGTFTEYGDYSVNFICKILEDGSLDSTFHRSSGANDYINCSAIQPDGKVLLGGAFNGYNAMVKNGIVRINSDGSIDPNFHSGTGVLSGGAQIHAILVQDDGKIMIAGNFEKYNGTAANDIARLNADGTIDTSFNSGTGVNTTIYAIAKLQNGKYLIGGAYTDYNGVSSNNLTCLNSDGSIDLTFTAGTGTNLGIYSILDEPGNKVLISGVLTTYNGTTVNRLMRINYNGTIDASFNTGTGANNTIRKVFRQTDGKYVIGGDFTQFNGTVKNRLVRLNANGSIDATFSTGTGFNGAVYDIFQQSNNKLVVSGYFTTYNGANHQGISRLYPDGTLDLTFYPAVMVYPGSIYTFNIKNMTISPDENMIVSGDFLAINGIGRNRVAKLNNCVAEVGHDVQIACDSYTWINGITYTVSNHTAMHTIMSSQGCDSMIYLDLTVNYSTYASQSFTACDTYTWSENNETYTATGLYNDTLINSVGCDSIITLHLTILNSTFNTLTEINCDSYTWLQNGVTYFTSGQYIDTIPNAAGCDSIVTLDLTIHTSSTSSSFASACGPYTWTQNGFTYTISGLYNDTIPNALGCDSIITLNLTIGEATTALVTEEACASYTWPQNNLTYTVSGLYNDTIPNALGCDSIITLNLTINHPTSSSQTVSSGTGSYFWPQNGVTYTVSGQYSDTIPNTAGCDSIIVLNLQIFNLQVQTYSMPSDINSCTGGVSIHATGTPEFIFDLGNGITETSNGYTFIDSLCPGIYSLLTTDGNGDTLSTTVVIPSDSNFVFNNPFIDSLAIGSLGLTIADCTIDYNSIDTAYIQSVFANGNEVTIVWNIIDASGSNFDTTTYVLNNGSGVYNLELSVFCPLKSMGQYFAVVQSVYFSGQGISLLGMGENNMVNAAIFPNPTSEFVFITFDQGQAALTITDLQGKLISTETIYSGMQISLKDLTSGVYFFELSTGNGRAVKRVVKTACGE